MSDRFTLSTPASRDLDEILTYVLERGGPTVAKHVAEGLETACRKLSESPEIGHKREDLTTAPVLFWSVWSYLVVYEPNTKPLAIIRVLHGARDVQAILDEGE